LVGYWADALAEALAETAALADALAEALTEPPTDALVDALAEAPAVALIDELADALAEALAEALVLALCIAGGVSGGPTLTLRVIGVPGLTEVPAAGIVPMTVSGSSRLVSSLIKATSSPASERAWAASPILRFETSGTRILPTGSVSAAATCAGSGGVCAGVSRSVVSSAEVASPTTAFWSSVLDDLSPGD